MKQKYVLFLFLSMWYVQNFAQHSPYFSPQLDSLYQISQKYLSGYAYKDAIEEAMQLLEQANKCDNDYYEYHGNRILGYSYEDLNDTIRAKKHYEDALVYAMAMRNDTILISAYNSLGNIYSQDKNTTQKGINYYRKEIAIANKIGLNKSIITPTLNIAWTYIDNKEYKKAFPYLEEVSTYMKEDESGEAMADLNYLWAKYYEGIGDFDSSEEGFKKSIPVVEADSLILLASVVYEDYSKLLFKQKKYKEAYLALNKYNDYKSKIFEKEKLKQIEAANVKFDVREYQRDLEIAKKEQKSKDQEIAKSQEKMLMMVVSSIVLLIILLALYKISSSRRKLIKELSVKNKELSSAKEEAEKLSLLKTKFFSTISHELRTPLYGVIGLTSILMEDEALKNHENDLKSLKFSADYLLALINDVLQMNKMESNLLKLENTDFNLSDLLHSIVKSFEFTRLQNKNTLHLEIDDDLSMSLVGDTVRLSQILMNLVGNAMKFTERGEIWLRAVLLQKTEDSEKILFEVEDNGLGIPKNKQELVFEEFSQLKSSNYNYQGTGLGLPIVKKLLRLFDSQIYLKSDEGKGSVFSFTIDFVRSSKMETPSLPETVENIKISSENREVRKILIVDDNRINQVVTRRILEKKSIFCEISDNGLDAIKKVREGDYDLVLMDVNMPGISGLEATQRIREFNTTIPIVALTAVEIEEIRDEIYQAGMTDIIVKPYDNTVFYQVIFRNLSSEVLSD